MDLTEPFLFVVVTLLLPETAAKQCSILGPTTTSSVCRLPGELAELAAELTRCQPRQLIGANFPSTCRPTANLATAEGK